MASRAVVCSTCQGPGLRRALDSAHPGRALPAVPRQNWAHELQAPNGTRGIDDLTSDEVLFLASTQMLCIPTPVINAFRWACHKRHRRTGRPRSSRCCATFAAGTRVGCARTSTAARRGDGRRRSVPPLRATCRFFVMCVRVFTTRPRTTPARGPPRKRSTSTPSSSTSALGPRSLVAATSPPSTASGQAWLGSSARHSATSAASLTAGARVHRALGSARRRRGQRLPSRRAATSPGRATARPRAGAARRAAGRRSRDA